MKDKIKKIVAYIFRSWEDELEFGRPRMWPIRPRHKIIRILLPPFFIELLGYLIFLLIFLLWLYQLLALLWSILVFLWSNIYFVIVIVILVCFLISLFTKK